MSSLGSPSLDIRHVERGTDTPDETLVQSAARLVDQACTNKSGDQGVIKWLSPFVEPPTSAGFSSSSAYVFRRSPPNKHSLLHTLPQTSPSQSLSLLDWDAEPSDAESLGLAVLEEFVSGVNYLDPRSSAAQPSSRKRRRSIGEHNTPGDSSLIKRPRLPSRALGLSSLTAATPTRSAFATSSSSGPKPLTTLHGTARLRLGLRKRAPPGSRIAQDQSDESYDVSVHVKMTPRRQLGSGPPRVLAAETPDSTQSAGGTLEFGLRLPSKALKSTGNKLQIQFPVDLATRTPRSAPLVSNPSRGTVLVPASPSPVTARIAEVPATSLDNGDSWMDSRVAASVSYSSSLGASAEASNSILLPPSPASLSRRPNLPSESSAAPEDGSAQTSRVSEGSTPDVLVSASLSLSLQELERTERSRRDEHTNGSPNKDPVHTHEHNNAVLSWMEPSVQYDSSQEPSISPPRQPVGRPISGAMMLSPSDPAKSLLSTDTSISWDLSYLPPTNPNRSGALAPVSPHRPKPTPSFSAKASSTSTARGEWRDVIPAIQRPTPHLDDLALPDPQEPSGLGMISALYDSSQDSSYLPGPQDPVSAKPLSPQERGSTPAPSWGSSQPGSLHPLSGARPSSSWSAPSVEDGLVAASRSLSLEDFESHVRPVSEASLGHLDGSPRTPLPETSAQARLSRDNTTSHPLTSTPRPVHLGVSRLAAYASTQDSISDTGSSNPRVLLPPKKNVNDDSIESINSPLPRRDGSTTNVGGRAGPRWVPAFLRLGPELEDDISFESQEVRAAAHISPPTPHPGEPEVKDSSAGDKSTSVPRFDVIPTTPGRSPIVAAETEITYDHQEPHLASLPTLKPTSRGTVDPLAHAVPPTSSSKIYRGSLHSVIPQPHFLPPLPSPPPSLTEGMLAALEASSVQIWLDEHGEPARDLSAVADAFARDPWKRAAWIVPVRGQPPWGECSAAVVTARPIVKARKKRTVLWTPAGLRSLWTQMEGFRELKRVGALAMSFEPAQGGAQTFEFIKLYHDARVSLKLRTILKVLEFRDEDGRGVDAGLDKVSVARDEGEGSRTTRRLLGSSTRLALVDETGRIVLIS